MMPTEGIVAIFDGVSKGLLVVGASAIVLSVSIAGLCTMFSWLDMHIGGFVKRVFTSVILGGAMIGGAGAFGIWMGSVFGM